MEPQADPGIEGTARPCRHRADGSGCAVVSDPADHQGATVNQFDLQELLATADRCGTLMSTWISRNGIGVVRALGETAGLGSAFLEVATRMLVNPATMARAQASLWSTYMDLWQNTSSRLLGAAPDAIPTESADRRFVGAGWHDYLVFDMLRQSYLVTAHWLEDTIGAIGLLDPQDRERVDFYTRQFINALSPSNFLLTNPEVLRATVETRGENLVRGIENLLHDLESSAGTGQGSRRMTAGRDVAVTRGRVVFRNDLMELIQFLPATDRVLRTPLLYVPPWLNRYYLVDLRPPYSWVQWMVDRGHTVFVVSWSRNGTTGPDRDLAAYVRDGARVALDAVARAVGEPAVHLSGYCLGGTLAGVAAAHIAASGGAPPASVTFLCSLLDFTLPGSLGSVVDEAAVTALGGTQTGSGGDVSRMLNLLRENDLIWSFVVDSYLLGRDRFPFDFLWWNADAVDVPRRLHSDYLEMLFRDNRLSRPGGLVLDGIALDLGRVVSPTYFLAAREDHIAPWRSVHAGTRLVGGPARFVLTMSGHIAGFIDPPGLRPTHHCVVDTECAGDADQWYAAAERRGGSWWLDWDAWLRRVGGDDTVPARQPGEGGLTVLGDAPGRYARADG
jgi:polyhydroxyalkanoate synthase